MDSVSRGDIEVVGFTDLIIGVRFHLSVDSDSVDTLLDGQFGLPSAIALACRNTSERG